jgi:ribosomal-protein-alanine N-acetyltransferase
MIISAYTHNDFPAIMKISDAAYSGVERPPEGVMRDMVSVSDVFVAREQAPYHPQCGQQLIIGFAIVKNIEEPYIWSIAVDPEFQGRFVGSNLLREIIRRYTLEKCSTITLHVRDDNPAQKLYFDQGFRVAAVAENYFDPHNGLFMRRTLP